MINCGYVWICCRLDSGNIPRRHTTLWSDRMSTGTLSPRHLKYCANNKGFNSSIGAADLVSNRARQSSLWYTVRAWTILSVNWSLQWMTTSIYWSARTKNGCHDNLKAHHRRHNATSIMWTRSYQRHLYNNSPSNIDLCGLLLLWVQVRLTIDFLCISLKVSSFLHIRSFHFDRASS